ncbi:MAG: ParA family protein [Proteobacteria bacterium]|nr:ParA family protein [Pseudomonadota bacterium]
MTAKVFTIAQQKGGAGKTTLAAQLAIAWIAQRRRIAVVDIDPQGSLSHWIELRRQSMGSAIGFTPSTLSGWRLAGEVERLMRLHDALLIDSPPHAMTEARIAVRAATLVIVPVQPSPLDLWATRPTLELARAEHRPVLLVVNRMPSRATLAHDMIGKLAAYEIGVARTTIGNRIAFAASMAVGSGVVETEPGSPAAQEIIALGEEIWNATPAAS